MTTLIIAEAGVNHDGDLDIARDLVRVAARAGADLVKFQTFTANRLTTARAPKAAYQIASTGAAESQQEMIRRLELSHSDHLALIEECRSVGVGFFSTGFDLESMAMLMELGLNRIKVPSGEITNLPYLQFVARQGVPVILSTGMANLGEVEAAIEVMLMGGVPRSDLTVLHCNTEYPTPMEDVNLGAMANMGRAFGVAYGYSDHTLGIELPIAAVALGATVIEKHFTLDRTRPGPDHKASLEPDELSAMVSAIRNVELAMGGDGVKRPSQSEVGNRLIARKSIVARIDIRAGDIFTTDNLTTKRPGSGLSPMRLDEILGRPAPRAFAADEVIEP